MRKTKPHKNALEIAAIGMHIFSWYSVEYYCVLFWNVYIAESSMVKKDSGK